jgi:hypothetical protein
MHCRGRGRCDGAVDQLAVGERGTSILHGQFVRIRSRLGIVVVTWR